MLNFGKSTLLWTEVCLARSQMRITPPQLALSEQKYFYQRRAMRRFGNSCLSCKPSVSMATRLSGAVGTGPDARCYFASSG